MAVTPSAVASPSLTIHLFGPMQVLAHGLPLPRLRSRKALWLLALLTLRHGRAVEREWLAGTLWPDTDTGRAFTNLRANLSELRGALGDQGVRLQSPGRHTLSLNLADANVDILAFDAAIRSQKPDALKQAVELYRGPLLEDCAEEWIGQERNAREQDCLRALQTLADRALTAGDYAAAIAFYRRAISLDPWTEAARRGWMEALAKSGDRNAAMQVYREFVEQLRGDPNAVPDEETSALYARLRTEARQQSQSQFHSPAQTQAQAAVLAREPVGNEAGVPAVSGYLPFPLTNLIGRAVERGEVAAKLRGSRLVTLTGSGGIGKTRLAIEVAGESVQDGTAYPDGVWLVALETLSEGSQVVTQIASILGLREEPERSLLASLTDHLRAKRLLLVLDNCEHLLTSCAQVVGHLLQECARVRILATSREALSIMGETVWQVPSLAVPDPKQLQEGDAALTQVLGACESVQLFVERAQAGQKDFALVPGNAMTVAQICFQLEGIPLAIELAAARVRSLTVEQIAARLNSRLGLLTVGNRAAQSRQQTLRTTLDWSYTLLSEAERALLGRLSVFAGGWTLEAAEQTGSGGGMEAEQILNLLTGLVDKSLVTFEEPEENSGGRYRLLETVRQYAAEKLRARNEEEKVRDRHRDWFLLLAEEAALHLKGGGQKHWLHRLDREYDNLRAALAWSAPDRPGAKAELRLVSALWRFWYVRGIYSEGRGYLRGALEREDAQERTLARAQALNGAGALAYDQGDYGAARALFEESLSIAREREDTPGIANPLGNLGNIALAVGEIGSALTLYEESLTLKRKLDDRAGIALALSNTGIVLRQQGDYAAAQNCFEESLSIARFLEDRLGMARALLNMGNVASNQDDPVLERTCIEESLSLFRELGDKQGIARSLGNRGNALNNAGEWEAARACIEESMNLFQELGDRRGIAQALGNLGDIAKSQADYASARALYTRRLRLLQRPDDKPAVVASLEDLAIVLLIQAEPGKAVQLWGAAEMLRETLGFPLPDNKRKARDQYLEQARSALGEAAFTIAWEEGSALPWEQATHLL